MKTPLVMATVGVMALAGQGPCAKQDAHSAKDDEKGKILFAEGNFDDAKKFATGADFEAKSKATKSFNPAAPQLHVGYYSAFPEQLGATEYLLQVFDRTEGGSAPVHVERRDAKSETAQVTAGWTFDIPTWPPPQDAEKLVSNDVWIKPGHRYEVMILKPFAKGEFSVGGDVQAPPAPTPTPGKKAPKEDPIEHSAPPKQKKPR